MIRHTVTLLKIIQINLTKMKTRISYLAAIMVLSIMATASGFAQQGSIDLKTPEVRDKVFDQILNDHELMMNFMNRLRTNEHAMMMMKSGMTNQDTDNPEEMSGMMSDMMMKCDMDSSMCRNMTSMMAEHDKILEQLSKVLSEKEDAQYELRKKPQHRHR